MPDRLRAGRRGRDRIGGHVIELDTTDFARVDYEGLCIRIRQLCASETERQ